MSQTKTKIDTEIEIEIETVKLSKVKFQKMIFLMNLQLLK